MEIKKVVFLAQGLSLPRIIKRVTSFYERGFDVEIYGFDRSEFLKVNVYPEGIKVISLGSLPDGKGYLNNLREHHKKMPKIIKANNKEGVLFYTMGFIPTFMAFMYAQRPYIYEISDLIYGTFRHELLTNIFAFVDRLMIKKSHLTVMTSQGFIDFLYKGKQPKNVMAQPNRLNSSFFGAVNRPKPSVNDSLRFGFVGYLRYTNTVFRFARIIGEKYPNYSFTFFGDSKFAVDAKALADKYENVHFKGKFRSPEDLVDIYNSLDIIVACYDTTTFNERVAEPNKLYESLFFCKPIIVSPDIYLSERVKALKCGYVIDATSDENVNAFIEKLKIEDAKTISQHEYDIDLKEIIDNPNDIFKHADL